VQSPGRKARHKAHMGFEQEAYNAECAAIARALGTAARRRARSLVISPPSQALRLPSGGWPQTTPGQARSTPSQPGNTSLSSAAGNQESPVVP